MKLNVRLLLIILTLVSLVQAQNSTKVIKNSTNNEHVSEVTNSLLVSKDKLTYTDTQKTFDTKDKNVVHPETDWFADSRFGMFIHWGVFAVPAGIWKG